VFAWFAPEIPDDLRAQEGCYFTTPCGLEFNGRCPYGAPGARLWVREAFRIFHGPDIRLQYRADGANHFEGDTRLLTEDSAYLPGETPPWKPSIFMPRWACRLVLEVEAVRVERLQQITDADVRSEGVETVALDRDRAVEFRLKDFARGWDSINGKRAPWASNPWVWVIEFRILP
jgi:hypothetical protein